MTPRLTADYAKNNCNRTLTVKVIVENVVTCFYGTQCSIVIVREQTTLINKHRIVLLYFVLFAFSGFSLLL